VVSLHSRFARYSELDEIALRDLATSVSLPPSAPSYIPITPAEQDLLLTCSQYDREHNRTDGGVTGGVTGGWKRVPRTLALPVSFFRKTSSTEEGGTWGKAVADVDAPADLVMAWLWSFTTCVRAQR
jgi:hypothetical protein